MIDITANKSRDDEESTLERREELDLMKARCAALESLLVKRIMEIKEHDKTKENESLLKGCESDKEYLFHNMKDGISFSTN